MRVELPEAWPLYKIAQVSGIAAGFNLFTPTTNGSYYLVICGKDAADGSAPTNVFIDVVLVTAIAGWVPVTLSSTTSAGAPGARTYSNATGALKVAVATGTTWYVDVALVRFPA